jgi:carboxymethylproline synthase
MKDAILLKERRENILLLTFNHEKSQNPFSEALQDAVMAAIEDAEKDDEVAAIVLYGGEGRSFSAGGDFKEAVEMGDPEVIAFALNKVVDLYVTILRSTKPVVAAIDKHAIGMGFQVAILADYRICTEHTAFIMPELKNGVACTLGCAMTEYLFGRFVMQEICYEGNKIPSGSLLHLKLVNEITDAGSLLSRAIEKAQQYGAYPSKAFRGTKRANNARYIQILEDVRQQTIDVHTDVFISKEHRTHMENILGKNKS